MLTDYAALVDAAAAGNDDDGARGGLEVWVLRVSGAGGTVVVGSVVLQPADDGDAGALRVNNLVVDPTVQGRGYGRRLMRLAE